MTHFNHEWDTTKTPAVPVSVGDRYYAQDLNDDFNYLKHLPYEAIIANNHLGIIKPPIVQFDHENSILSIGSSLCAIPLPTQVLDTDTDFVIPPTTKTTKRLERIQINPATLDLTSINLNTLYFIIGTPQKNSLLPRNKALLSEQYYSRVEYNGSYSLVTINELEQLDEYILIGTIILMRQLDEQYSIVIIGKQLEISNTLFLSTVINTDADMYFDTDYQEHHWLTEINDLLESNYDTISCRNFIPIPTKQVLLNNRYTHSYINVPVSIRGYLEDSVIDVGDIIASNFTVVDVRATIRNCYIHIKSITKTEGYGYVYGVFTQTSYMINCDIQIDKISSQDTQLASNQIVAGIISSYQTYSPSSYIGCKIQINNLQSAGGNCIGVLQGIFSNCFFKMSKYTGNGRVSIFNASYVHIYNSEIEDSNFTTSDFNNTNSHNFIETLTGTILKA